VTTCALRLAKVACNLDLNFAERGWLLLVKRKRNRGAFRPPALSTFGSFKAMGKSCAERGA
jgi:hypothetical protein